MPGANYWLIVGPIVFALAIAIWIVLVLLGARRRRRYERVSEQPDRGEVAGGRIHGGPSQGNRRDRAPRHG
ncbi:MAG TPA: hypothetical protein VFU43_26135 [Streptosporangiaceae bacterium]|nr:hypothetical protein [Streptosporangiaceae bacterium]